MYINTYSYRFAVLKSERKVLWEGSATGVSLSRLGNTFSKLGNIRHSCCHGIQLPEGLNNLFFFRFLAISSLLLIFNHEFGVVKIAFSELPVALHHEVLSVHPQSPVFILVRLQELELFIAEVSFSHKLGLCHQVNFLPFLAGLNIIFDGFNANICLNEGQQHDKQKAQKPAARSLHLFCSYFTSFLLAFLSSSRQKDPFYLLRVFTLSGGVEQGRLTAALEGSDPWSNSHAIGLSIIIIKLHSVFTPQTVFQFLK